MKTTLITVAVATLTAAAPAQPSPATTVTPHINPVAPHIADHHILPRWNGLTPKQKDILAAAGVTAGVAHDQFNPASWGGHIARRDDSHIGDHEILPRWNGLTPKQKDILAAAGVAAGVAHDQFNPASWGGHIARRDGSDIGDHEILPRWNGLTPKQKDILAAAGVAAGVAHDQFNPASWGGHIARRDEDAAAEA